MKKHFPGHFSPTDHEQKKLWEGCLFVLDANILLNLYRYSDATRVEFIKILSSLKSRLWIPHRAAEEYLANRLLVIEQQEKAYDDATKSIDSLKRDLENTRQHPFVKKTTMKKVVDVFELLCSELEGNKGAYSKRIFDDDIKDSIAHLFESRIGSPYTTEQIELILKEGEERYKQKIPPGYKDSYKADNPELFQEQCRKFGDLIVWKQIIDKAKELGVGVVLITDDKKEDWWVRFRGKTVGPRPELVKEFELSIGSTFQMYQADRFLEFAREFLDQKVSPEILDEIREVRRRSVINESDGKNSSLNVRRSFEKEYIIHQANRISMEMSKLEEHLRDISVRKANILALVKRAEKEQEVELNDEFIMDGVRDASREKLGHWVGELELMRLRESELVERLRNLRAELSFVGEKLEKNERDD
jgi:hypothetical protein